jgi:hypothetical protein
MTGQDPDTFHLPATAARDSRWHGRLVIPVTGDEITGAVIGNALSRLPGVSAPAVSTRIFSEGINVLWADYQWVRHMGPARMIEAEPFLGLLRSLTDGVLDAAAAGARTVVDFSTDYVGALPVIRSLYPDAILVEVDGGWPPASTGTPTLSVTLDRLSGSLAAFRSFVRDLGSDAGGSDLTAAHEALRSRQVPGPAPIRPPAGAGPRPVGGPPPDAMRDRLITVVGCGRSGTTWLESLLMTHPLAGGIEETETWLFHQLESLWSNFESGSGLSAFLDEASFTQLLRRFCDAMFLSALASHSPGAEFFVEKSPIHSRYVSHIAAVYPDAWFIHLVRDGRDVARSITKVPFFEQPSLVGAARMWTDTVREVAGSTPGVPRFRELRYEQLFADPEQTVRDIFRWVGLPDGQAVEDPLHDAVSRRVSVHAGEAARVGPGVWQDMRASERAQIYAAAGGELVSRGYATTFDVIRAALHPAFLTARAEMRRQRAHQGDPPRQ